MTYAAPWELSLIKIGSFSGNRVDAVVVGAEALKSYIATVAPLAIQKRITSSFPFARGRICVGIRWALDYSHTACTLG